MFLQALDLTTAWRPELLPDEALLFVQDAVGLYEGKFKIPQYQNGHVYLTSHRICYVDNEEPRKSSVAIELANLEKYEYYAGFLKSSPKITLFPNTARVLASSQSIYATQARGISVSQLPGRGQGPSPRKQLATWVCSICSFANELPANFNPATERNAIPPCLSCGIKPALTELLKAAIANAAPRSSPSPAHSPYQPPQPQPTEIHHQYHGEPMDDYTSNRASTSNSIPSRFVCPRCTFENHPSLLSCELCGASLIALDPSTTSRPTRPASPGPSLEMARPQLELPEYIKISFRAGGDKVFHERLKGAMVQRKWLLINAPPIPLPQSTVGTPNSASGTSTPKAIGIAGLERLGLDARKTNETIIGSAFADLEALMASAKEIIALAESFAATSAASSSASALLSESAAASTVNGMALTKDMLDDSSSNSSTSGADALYLSELARTLAEYLTDDARGLLRRAGGIMSLVDLWAGFNRARNGVELVRPADFAKAARLWDPLGLPVRLREFRNGLLVVQRADWTDQKTITQLLAWIREGRAGAGAGGVGATGDTATADSSRAHVPARFGRGVTALEAAGRFGWSVGVATEELEMAEENGALCREEGVEGLRFWENWIARTSMEQEVGALHVVSPTASAGAVELPLG